MRTKQVTDFKLSELLEKEVRKNYLKLLIIGIITNFIQIKTESVIQV